MTATYFPLLKFVGVEAARVVEEEGLPVLNMLASMVQSRRVTSRGGSKGALSTAVNRLDCAAYEL